MQQGRAHAALSPPPHANMHIAYFLVIMVRVDGVLASCRNDGLAYKPVLPRSHVWGTAKMLGLDERVLPSCLKLPISSSFPKL